MKKISSLQNPLIKELKQLSLNRKQKKSEQFLVEGLREVSLAIKNGFVVESVFFCESCFDETLLKNALGEIPLQKKILLSDECFSTVTLREKGSVVLAVLKKKAFSLEDFKDCKNLLVLESVEKPGNLGALLRTADAALVDGIILLDPLADPYSPNVIRASLGAVFTMPILKLSSQDFFAFCEERQITTLAAVVDKKALSYSQYVFPKKTAILLGSEDKGLKPQTQLQVKARLTIPMNGQVNSLNVSCAGAILLYAKASSGS